MTVAPKDDYFEITALCESQAVISFCFYFWVLDKTAKTTIKTTIAKIASVVIKV